MRFSLIVTAWVISCAIAMPTRGAEKTIVFVDGTRMPIRSYEVKGGVVQFTTADGKLRSVPRSYVNLVATEQANSGTNSAPAPPSRPPAPPPPRPAPPEPAPMRTESVTAEPPIAEPIVEPDPAPPPRPTRDVPPNMDLASPPPVWSNDELHVSLQVPSIAWRLEDMPPSFDVAVALENDSTEARATLALIRQKLRGRGDFNDVVGEVESSISTAPGFRSISQGPLGLDPYQAHEFRFSKNVGFVTVYNRLVIVYSRDLAYVLSLTCPDARLAENERDFDALVQGLVIRKSRDDLSF